jgi:DNA polymerase III subunit gamma/tau
MSYQVLARKWRPQDFASLIGQEAIVKALTNALSERRIAQAYLFSGIRGVGKTTAARLLAKSLNCAEGPTATPCNRCTPCVEITGGSDLDVIEVDAATYSKVEQVRELTESLRYGPARDRYKVVVLDEIHRLSRQAFDALLKIVEEPPPHLVFVFATTEAEAVPATVLSRCQEFHFRRVSSEVLSRHLRSIAEAEEIEVSDPALRLISRAGEGSVRDSVALLDQLATFGAGVIADEDAARLVGGLDAGLLHDLLAAVLAGRGDEVSAAARRLEDEGRDPRQAYTQFLAFARDALRIALSRDGDAPRVDLPEEDAAALAELARGAGYENLLRLLHQLLASENLVRRSDHGYLAVEIALLRAAELPKLTRVEELLRGGPVDAPPQERSSRTAAEAAAPPSRSTAADRPEPQRPEPRPPERGRPEPQRPASPREEPPAEPERREPPPPEPEPEREEPPDAPGQDEEPRREPPRERPERREPGEAPQSPPSGAVSSPQDEQRRADAGDLPRSTAAFLDEVRRSKQPLAAHLVEAELAFAGDTLRIRHPPGDDWLPTRLSRAANRDLVTTAVERTWGAGARWRLEEGEAQAVAEEEAPEEAAVPPEVAEHPTVQTVLELFGGRIDTVEEREER